LNEATACCIKIAQRHAYAQELLDLTNKEVISTKSRLQNLNSVLDAHQVLRVGGRLQLGSLPYDQKHQVILLPDHVTRLIIKYEHLRSLHVGSQLLLSLLRQRYWITNGRSVIRKIIHSCHKCYKMNASAAQQLMGQLPKERIEPSRPFINVGIDLAVHSSLRQEQLVAR
jgi:hypothetical protein